jgi:hypothetical protein
MGEHLLSPLLQNEKVLATLLARGEYVLSLFPLDMDMRSPLSPSDKNLPSILIDVRICV